MRVSTIVWVMLVSFAALALQLVKYSVQDVTQEVEALQAELDDERDELKMLQAEWAYLNRADRLRTLSDKYLQLVSMSGERIVVLDVVPALSAAGGAQLLAEDYTRPRYIIPTGGR